MYGLLYNDGSVDSDGQYAYNSQSRDLVLTLPESAGGGVSVETFSGEIDSDFPITLQPGERDSREHGRRFEFTFGGGGARITTQTFSGDIVIRRGSRRGDRKGD